MALSAAARLRKYHENREYRELVKARARAWYAANREQCDLIAMATHGHRGLNDVVRGSVASALRHRTMVPVLMVRGQPK